MLGYGVFSGPDGVRRTGARVAGGVLDLAAAAGPDLAPVLGGGTLDPLLAAGPAGLGGGGRPPRGPPTARSCRRGRGEPAPAVHRRRLRRLLRLASTTPATSARSSGPAPDPLPAELEAPAGRLPRPRRHRRRLRDAGRAPVRAAPDVAGEVVSAPTARLDLEAEVGFVVGVGSEQGTRVPLEDLERHVFGVCLVNDWSARDVQAWEYVPLGPFLGKSLRHVGLAVGRAAGRARGRPGRAAAARRRRRCPTSTTPPHRPGGSTSPSRSRSTAPWSPGRPSRRCTGRPPSSWPT